MASAELGRVTRTDGVVRYTVRPGGRIEEARLTHEADAFFGARLEPVSGHSDGVRVADLMHGGVAERAGLMIGDRLLAIDDQVVRSVPEFRSSILALSPEARVTIRYEREQRTVTVDARFFGRREAIEERTFLESAGLHAYLPRAGFEVVTAPALVSKLVLGADRDSVVLSDVAPGGPAYREGLRAGDALLQVQGQPVQTAEEVKAILDAQPPGTILRVEAAKADERFAARVRLEDPDASVYWDIPVLFHLSSDRAGTGMHVGTVLFSYERTDLPTPRREGSSKLGLSFLLGLVHYQHDREGPELRLLWVVPIPL